MARCEPHPGHCHPVSIRKGHLGNRAEAEGSNVKKMIPATAIRAIPIFLFIVTELP